MKFLSKICKDAMAKRSVTIRRLKRFVGIQVCQIEMLHNIIGERNDEIIESSKELKQLKLDRLDSQFETAIIVK